MRVLTVVDNINHLGYLRLKASCEKFGYDLHTIHTPFVWGGQMKSIYEWCKQNEGPFIYQDGFDTWALGPFEEVEDKLPIGRFLVSAEKNCFPMKELESKYPHCDTPWKYVNAGQWLTTCATFVELYERTKQQHPNDQAWLSLQLINPDNHMHLDTGCQLFQSCAFEGPDDFSFDDGRIINNYTKTKPLFVHFNGHTNPAHIEKALQESVK